LSYYALIIGAFIVVGLVITAYGWKTYQKGKTKRQWPSVTGEITGALLASEENDLLPDIRFRYTVDAQSYEGRLEFPAGTTPMPGFAHHQLEKYPLGSQVAVYYNPQDPAQATLEPGANDDWMVLAIGIGVTLLGILALFFSG